LAREIVPFLFALCRPLLRLYVWFAWYTQAAWQFTRRKRDSIPDIRDLTVILNKDGLLVLDKNPELLINSTKPWRNVLSLQTQAFFKFPVYANFNLEHLFHFVNRLDAPTSGLICLAYTAKMANLRPRSAQTRITVLRHGYLNKLPASYVLLEPLTGRRHQLRIHCAVGLGHPIAGDLIYARLHAIDDVYEAANYPLHRMMLHAYRLDLVLLPNRSPFKKRTTLEESCPSELRFDLRSSHNLLSDKRTRWTDKEIFEEL
uniref:PseudoU_synth_2 domain-containing protein n=1 Tax=Schistocephalus solidus TaxID=70667 RepID=A0A183T6Y0_SCHSO